MSDNKPMRITAHLSPARPGEAAFRGFSVEEANDLLLAVYRARLEGRFAGADVTVEIGGDEPVAQVEGAGDPVRARVIRDEARRIGLSIKWAFSTLGPGLPPARE